MNKLVNRTFVSRLGGIAGLLGIALALVQVSRLAATIPAIERSLQILPNLFAIVWLVSIYAFQSPHIGRLGSLGLGAAEVGVAAIIIFGLIEEVAGTNPGNWADTFLASSAITLVFTVVAVLYVWGILAIGTASLQMGMLPRGVWFCGWSE